LKATPVFIDDPKDVDKLIWSPSCQNNLAVYLVEEHRKVKAQEALHARKRGPEPDKRPVGIVVKGCDSRAVAQILSENVIDRSEVYVIGIPCSGVIDPKKAIMILFQEGNLDLEKDFERVLFDKCIECVHPNPVISDEVLGDEVEVKGKEIPDQLDDMSLEERWGFWKNELSRCLRCYACRAACPMCYCVECAVDPTDISITPFTPAKSKAERPDWIEQDPVTSETMFFHLVRAFHLTGRCVDCGECERVCPMFIKVHKLTKHLNKMAKEKYGHEAGMDPDPSKKPLLAVADENDPGEVIS
jgi:ferredoxin